VLRDGFDVEAVSSGWADDLDVDFPAQVHSLSTLKRTAELAVKAGVKPPTSAIALYEDWIRDPSTDAFQLVGRDADPTRPEVSTQDTQSFLEDQLKILEAFRTKASDQAKGDASKGRASRKSEEAGFLSPREAPDGLVSDHIGPVQFNMGGIQVDADDMLQRLKVRYQRFRSFPLWGSFADTCIRTGRNTAHRSRHRHRLPPKRSPI
jgi:dynein light intermediate chain 1, cytosolic